MSHRRPSAVLLAAPVTLVLLCPLFFAVSSAADETPVTPRCYVYIVRPTADEIALDGELKPEEWQTAVPVAAFHTPAGDLVRNQTLVRILYDWEALWFGVTCYERAMEKVKSTGQEGSAAVLEDDCLELFVGVGAQPETCIHLALNPAGSKMALVGKDTPWGKEWQVATARAKTAWSAEIKLPFAAFGVEMPGLLDVWQVNVARRRQAGLETTEITRWTPIAPDPALPCSNGRLLFIQQPMPEGVSLFDGLTRKLGGPARVFGDIGYVDANGQNLLYRYSDLLAFTLSERLQATNEALATLKTYFEKHPDSDKAEGFWRCFRQWDSLVRDVQGARVANALAWSWGTLDILELSDSIAELQRQVRSVP